LICGLIALLLVRVVQKIITPTEPALPSDISVGPDPGAKVAVRISNSRDCSVGEILVVGSHDALRVENSNGITVGRAATIKIAGEDDSGSRS
jgi:hypothetical protein